MTYFLCKNGKHATIEGMFLGGKIRLGNINNPYSWEHEPELWRAFDDMLSAIRTDISSGRLPEIIRNRKRADMGNYKVIL